jgi:hypothetical protein
LERMFLTRSVMLCACRVAYPGEIPATSVGYPGVLPTAVVVTVSNA